MDGTACINCDRDSSRCRVLVDLDTGRALGVVCRDCLTAQFGTTIERPAWRRDEGCAVCDRDDFYGLPRASRSREPRETGPAASRYEYAVDDETLALCDEHLAGLAGEVPVARPVVADGGF